MNLTLFIAALLMTVVAMGFAVKPLLVSYERRSSGSAKLSLLAIIVVFGMGIALYGIVGKPELSNVRPTSAGTATAMQTTPSSQNSDKVGSVTSLLNGLQARLAENPDDAKGWLLLAQSYDHLGNSAEARDAYAKAVELGMTNAALEARLNEVTSTGDPAAAEIRGRISVAATVADRVGPDDVVYVVAKTDNNPMPLAVLRRSASELPFDFVLSDANSMVQGGGISSAATVTVSARLSKTGDALNTATELGASAQSVDPASAGDLALVIDVVPGS
jgi:hypothetical protein